MVPTALLRAGRENAPRALDAGEEQIAFRESVRDRLLAVDILASRDRVKCHAGMPVIGRCDHHAIYVVAVQRFAVVQHGLGWRPHERSRFETPRLVHIAGGDDFDAGDSFQESREHHAARARADQPDADAVARRQQRSGSGSGEKNSAVHAAANSMRSKAARHNADRTGNTFDF